MESKNRNKIYEQRMKKKELDYEYLNYMDF